MRPPTAAETFFITVGLVLLLGVMFFCFGTFMLPRDTY